MISVGGVDDQGTRAHGDDVLAVWSARGATQDGIAKPGINARQPGARAAVLFYVIGATSIPATRPRGSSLCRGTSSCQVAMPPLSRARNVSAIFSSLPVRAMAKAARAPQASARPGLGPASRLLGGVRRQLTTTGAHDPAEPRI